MRPRTRILAQFFRGDGFQVPPGQQQISFPPLLVAALKACATSRQLDLGKAIHLDSIYSGIEGNAFVSTTLIAMYARCGVMADAREIFDAMAVKNIVAWTALVLGYAENGDPRLGLDLFSRMDQSPDAPAFVAAAMACANAALEEQGTEIDGKIFKIWSLDRAMEIHSRAAKRGFDRSNRFLANTLVDLYSKCGSLVDSWRAFEAIATPCVVSWTALIQGLVENGESEIGLDFFDHARKVCDVNSRTLVAAMLACMDLAEKEEGTRVLFREGQSDGALEKVAKVVKPKLLERSIELHALAIDRGCESDRFVANALVRLYAKCGSVADAESVFRGMVSPDVVSWTALILGFELNTDSEQALECFSAMERSGCRPDARTYTAALTAATTLADFDRGRRIHALVARAGIEDEGFISACLVDFYGKCGRIRSARYVFDSTAKIGVVHWGALMAGFGRQGDSGVVIGLFETMIDEGVEPNSVVCLAVLSACGHAGFLVRGRKFFGSMRSRYGIRPGIEHYNAMVDLLGRSNRLDDAVLMIRSMPYRSTVVTWRSLLGACWRLKNASIGRMAFDSIIESDPSEVSAYVLMSNIYGSLGMFDEKAKIRAMGGLNEETLEQYSALD